MSVLAKADIDDLTRFWAAEDKLPPYNILRPAETGLVMLRGRIGGSGAPFNVGEATVTRCAVQIENGPLGQAYVMGTNRRHAEIAAVYDALLQRDEDHERLLKGVIAHLSAQHKRMKRERAAKVAATKVDFFTLVRGEDE